MVYAGNVVFMCNFCKDSDIRQLNYHDTMTDLINIRKPMCWPGWFCCGAVSCRNQLEAEIVRSVENRLRNEAITNAASRLNRLCAFRTGSYGGQARYLSVIAKHNVKLPFSDTGPTAIEYKVNLANPAVVLGKEWFEI
jgi:hypothetical protein